MPQTPHVEKCILPRKLVCVAAPGKRKRSEFIRQAIRKAIRQAEYKAIREAYRKQPDSVQDVDDWFTTEEYKG